MVILDVRTPEEFAAQHVDGAVNYDVQQLLGGKLPAIDKNEEIVAYCNSGNRSGVATILLKRHGFTNVSNAGGIGDMERLGHKLV